MELILGVKNMLVSTLVTPNVLPGISHILPRVAGGGSVEVLLKNTETGTVVLVLESFHYN